MSVILPVRLVAKPWGRDSLPPPFAAPEGQRIGEIWVESPAGLESILVKFLFTSDRLSVQVHPDDAATEAAGLGRSGKDECWLILDAEPGAMTGIGFIRDYPVEQLRAAALDGSIEGMLQWHEVQAGDFFSIPAGTVHAIGPGISLLEVQRSNDITYRLFDYGRPRELHLETGLQVARASPFPPEQRRQVASQQHATLLDGPFFRVDHLAGQPDGALLAAYAGHAALVLPLSGPVTVAGELVEPGQCAVASDLVQVACAAGTTLLVTRPAG